MNDEVKIAALGAFLFGALYIASVLAAALVYGSATSAYLAIASAGASYIAQVLIALCALGLISARYANIAWGAAALAGVSAGVILIGG